MFVAQLVKPDLSLPEAVVQSIEHFRLQGGGMENPIEGVTAQKKSVFCHRLCFLDPITGQFT